MFSSKMTTRGLIGVAVCGATYQLPAGLAGAVTDLAVVCAASALATVAPAASAAPVTVATAMAA